MKSCSLVEFWQCLKMNCDSNFRKILSEFAVWLENEDGCRKRAYLADIFYPMNQLKNSEGSRENIFIS